MNEKNEKLSVDTNHLTEGEINYLNKLSKLQKDNLIKEIKNNFQDVEKFKKILDEEVNAYISRTKSEKNKQLMDGYRKNIKAKLGDTMTTSESKGLPSSKKKSPEKKESIKGESIFTCEGLAGNIKVKKVNNTVFIQNIVDGKIKDANIYKGQEKLTFKINGQNVDIKIQKNEKGEITGFSKENGETPKAPKNEDKDTKSQDIQEKDAKNEKKPVLTNKTAQGEPGKETSNEAQKEVDKLKDKIMKLEGDYIDTNNKIEALDKQISDNKDKIKK